jgi:hypothetical protein
LDDRAHSAIAVREPGSIDYDRLFADAEGYRRLQSRGAATSAAGAAIDGC